MQGNTSKYADLLRALDGMRNLQAVGLLIGTFVVAAIILMGGMATGAGWAVGLFGLIAMLTVAFGTNATGIILMHEANGTEAPGIAQALLGGMASFGKIVLIGLVLLALALAYTAVAAILLFVCKIPGLGPVLFAVLLPLMILLSGALYAALAFCGALMLPAVWRGAGIREALVTVLSIARQRLMEVIIRFFLLFLLLGLVFGILGMIVVSGSLYTLGLSAAILPGSGNFGMPGMMSGLGGFSGHGSGYAIATGFGLGVVYALLMGISNCAALMGLNLIYLKVSDGIDTAAAEQVLAERIAAARQAASQMEERMKQARPAPVASAPAPAPAAGLPGACPGCKANVAENDVFCGECGYKLR